VTTNYIDLAARFVHILAVITLVGGQTYAGLILPGAARRLSAEEGNKLSFELLHRQPAFVWGHLVAIVITGVIMAASRLPLILSYGAYGIVLSVKLLLVAILLALAAVNSFSVVPRLLRLMGGQPQDQNLTDQIRYLSGLSTLLVRLNVGLGIGIVLLAAVLASL
jgi:uncharacterized membrane protein